MSRQRRLAALPLAFALGIPAAVQAGESRIELTDGSVVTGELIGIEGGRYRLHSPTLGDLSIPESSIRALRPSSGGSAATGADQVSSQAAGRDYSAEIVSIQKQLTADQGLMSQVSALQNDPGVRQILSDPGLMRMVLSGDLEHLRDDARFQQLMRSPAIQSIMGQLLGR